MGSVWEARNTALGTAVAVKLLRPDTVFTVDGEARFEREIEVLASLDHPHLVRILDRGTSADGAPFFVMELLRGEDLGARLAREGTLSVEDTTTILTQACKGLTVAHGRGVIHRDLKPANLFLLDHGDGPFVKVLDFGIAKRATELGMTSTGTAVGTPYFMSPEQFFTPSKADHRADLWALGVVAYVCLAGVMPFVGETPSAIGLAAMQQAFTPITRRRPDLGPSWDLFFERALHADPAQRFASAEELSEGLRRAQSGTTPRTASTGIAGGPLSDEDREALALAPTDVVATLAAPQQPTAQRLETSAREVAQAATSIHGAGLARIHGSTRGWAIGAAALAGTICVALFVSSRGPREPPGSLESASSLGTTHAEPTALGSALAPTANRRETAEPSASAEPTASSVPSAQSRKLAGSSAAPGVSRPFPMNLVMACWRDTEGATATQSSSATIEIELTASGKVTSVRVRVHQNQFPGFRACVVTKLSQTSYGPGAKERLSSTVGLPRSFAKGAGPL
jgi:eukaryotic-like serine/threonine-protein kinase